MTMPSQEAYKVVFLIESTKAGLFKARQKGLGTVLLPRYLLQPAYFSKFPQLVGSAMGVPGPASFA